jgi:hypothetical protein
MMFLFPPRVGKLRGATMQYLPGKTVQCLNPDCAARGHWLRIQDAPYEHCANCGLPLHNVPPPLAQLAPRMRMRTRPLMSYRPMARPR